MSSGIDFHPVTTDTATNVVPTVKYILSLNISPTEKKMRIKAVFDLIGSDFYAQMFSANSTVFDSTAIGTLGYEEMDDQVARLATKLVRQDALGRPVDQIVKGFYDSLLGAAQEEAFRNAVSLDKHPTITRTMVGETCSWCRNLAGTWPYEPNSDIFRRHDNCDCLIVTSGLGSRSGIVKNYVKHDSLRTDEEAMKAIGVTEDYWYRKMENGERRFAKNYPHDIRWINRNQKGADGLTKPTNDYTLVVNQKEYELKTISRAKYKNIARSIKTAAKKAPTVKTRFMINLEKQKISNKLIESLRQYNVRNPSNKIAELRIFSEIDGERVVRLLE